MTTKVKPLNKINHIENEAYLEESQLMTLELTKSDNKSIKKSTSQISKGGF